MEKGECISIIESLLFVSGEPLDIKSISDILNLNIKDTKKILEQMIDVYKDNNRGIQLVKINNKYQLTTKPSNSIYIEKLLNINKRHSLSQAALETLAIITYKQPITRIEIDEIRGVKSDKAIQTLQEKKLIKESGRKNVPGRPILYKTTDQFLKYFGIDSIKNIISIDEIVRKYKENDKNISVDKK